MSSTNVSDINERLTPFNKIKRKDKNEYTYVKSGYSNLDNLIGGFILGQCSVWSGHSGNGKSSFLNQQMIEYTRQGYKTMIFSGELPDYSIKNTLYNIIAGKRYLTPSSRNYYYLADNSLKTIIDSYIGNSIYVYKNSSGVNPNYIIDTIRLAKNQLGVQMFILDNLMTMDLSVYDRDEYKAQTKFIISLENLSKELQVHIHVVMHPRKAIGYIRKSDISGSSNLTNAADNIFIVHRNGLDFRKGYKEYNPIVSEDFFQYDNYIDIIKNREEGVQEKVIGFYFIPESKQIVEQKGIEKPYIEDVKKYYYKKRKEQENGNNSQEEK